MLLEVEIPVLEQVLGGAPAGEPLTVIGLDFQLTLVPQTQVVEVTPYGTQVLAAFVQYFDHHLRRASHRARNVLDLCGRQAIPSPGSATCIAGHVEERTLARGKVNEPSRHVSLCSWRSSRTRPSPAGGFRWPPRSCDTS